MVSPETECKYVQENIFLLSRFRAESDGSESARRGAFMNQEVQQNVQDMAIAHVA